MSSLLFQHNAIEVVVPTVGLPVSLAFAAPAAHAYTGGWLSIQSNREA